MDDRLSPSIEKRGFARTVFLYGQIEVLLDEIAQELSVRFFVFSDTEVECVGFENRSCTFWLCRKNFLNLSSRIASKWVYFSSNHLFYLRDISQCSRHQVSLFSGQ